MAASQLPDGITIRSSLRLFLSLDIVGSTEFKQGAGGNDARSASLDGWAEAFLSFYQTSVEQMEAHWDHIRMEMGAVEPLNGSQRFTFGSAPAFWKGAGDEVLFSKVVHSPIDAMAAIHSFMALMRQHRRQFTHKGLRLDVKGAAWLAGFPVNNAEMMLPIRYEKLPGRLDEPVAENYRLLHLHRTGQLQMACQLDFIGPSVDLGFRLREHATPRRLVVSADLVWLLCHAHESCTNPERGRCFALNIPHIGYDGRRGLKGILGGQPYPLFWIEADPENEIDRAEDAVLGRSLSDHTPAPARFEDINRFCAAFLTGRTPLQTRPYIRDCADPEISALPQDHKARLDSIENLVKGELERLAPLDIPERGSGTIPDAARSFADRLAQTGPLQRSGDADTTSGLPAPKVP